MSRAGKTTYRLKLKVLSPLYIGGGENAKLTRLNYAFEPEEKKVYVLDEGKWISFLQKNRLLDYFVEEVRMRAGANSGGLDIYQWLRKNERLTRTPAGQILMRVSRAVHSTVHLTDFRNHDIHGFIRNGEGWPYIPGSSIKGALRTALIASLLAGGEEKNGTFLGETQRILAEQGKQKDKLNKLSASMEEKLLDFRREISGENMIFRGMTGISVSDSNPFPPENLFLLKKQDLILVNGRLKGERGSNRPLFRECARPGTEVEFTLTIDEYKINKAFGIRAFADLAAAMEKHFASLFGTSGVFSAWPASKIYLPAEALKENGRGIVILGGGAGYHSKTVLSPLAGSPHKASELAGKILNISFRQHKHYQDKPLAPRALKVARAGGKEVFMGFCRIREVDS